MIQFDGYPNNVLTLERPWMPVREWGGQSE